MMELQKQHKLFIIQIMLHWRVGDRLDITGNSIDYVFCKMLLYVKKTILGLEIFFVSIFICGVCTDIV